MFHNCNFKGPPNIVIMSFLPFLILIFIPISKQIKVETSELAGDPIKDYNCDKINYEKDTYVRCACLEGIWAFLVSIPDAESAWRLVGGLPSPLRIQNDTNNNNNNNGECFHIGRWVQKIYKVSEKTETSSLTTLTLDGDSESKELLLIVTNEQSWEVTTRNKMTGKKQKSCLQGSGLGSYCFYKLDGAIFELVEGRQLEGNCPTDLDNPVGALKPLECDDFTPTFPENYFKIQEEPLICDLIPPGHNIHIRQRRQQLPGFHQNRVKRQDPAAAAAPAAPAAGGGGPPAPGPEPIDPMEINEDFVNKTKYVGDKSFMSTVTEHVLSTLSRITKLNPPKEKPKDAVILPVKYLLEKSMEIARSICLPIKTDVWDLAMGSFLRHQTNVYHLKEPYIDYSAFIRIRDTLKECQEKSSEPFTFQTNLDAEGTGYNYWDTTGKLQKGFPEPEYRVCKSQKESSKAVMWPDRWFDVVVPVTPFAYANPKQYEPLIETAWKSFAIVHSHCFKYFSEYYNDHHTFTVSILPFFTNQIHDLWFLNDTYSAGNMTDEDVVYTESLNWYGGLVTDAHKLYEGLDDCYAAARALYYEDHEGIDVKKVMSGGYDRTIRVNKGYPWELDRPGKDISNKWQRRRKREAGNEDSNDDQNVENGRGLVSKRVTGQLPCPD